MQLKNEAFGAISQVEEENKKRQAQDIPRRHFLNSSFAHAAGTRGRKRVLFPRSLRVVYICRYTHVLPVCVSHSAPLFSFAPREKTTSRFAIYGDNNRGVIEKAARKLTKKNTKQSNERMSACSRNE